MGEWTNVSGANNWNATTWGTALTPAAPPTPVTPGPPGLVLTPGTAGTPVVCEAEGQHRSSFHANWLQEDDIDFWVPGTAVPADFARHTVFGMSQVVGSFGGTVTPLGGWGRYRVSEPPGSRREPDGTRDRHIVGTDWLRARLVRPWHLDGGPVLSNPPVSAIGICWGLTGQADTGLASPDAGLLTAGGSAFGGGVSDVLTVSFTGYGDLLGTDWLQLEPVTPGTATYLVTRAVGFAEWNPWRERYVMTLSTGVVPAEYLGTDTLQLCYYRQGEGCLGPILTLSAQAGLPDNTPLEGVDGYMHLEVQSATISRPVWANSWEGVVYSLLWFLSGSTGAAPWVQTAGAWGALAPLPANGTALGSWAALDGPLAGLLALHYDRETSWRDWLDTLCAPPSAGASAGGWGMVPLTATYGGGGTITLRRYGEHWTQGWGWAANGTALAVQLPVTGTFTEEITEPQYDWLQAYWPALGTVGPLLIAERRLNSTWYAYDAAYARRAELSVLDVGWVAAVDLGATGAVEAPLTWGLLDAVEQQQWEAARKPSITLRGPWWYGELGQQLGLVDPPTVNGDYRLLTTSTDLSTGEATWGLGRVQDRGSES